MVTYISRNMYFQLICKIYLKKQQPCWGFIFFIADYKYCEQSFNYTVGNNSIKKICTHFRYKLLTTAASSPIPCHYRIKNQLARFLRILSFHTIEQLVSSYITSASLNHKIFSTRRKFELQINNKVYILIFHLLKYQLSKLLDNA